MTMAKFKQFYTGEEGALQVFHSGPDGVYTFIASSGSSDNFAPYKSYLPYPHVGNRVPYSQGDIGTPPKSQTSGLYVYPTKTKELGIGAGFNSASADNKGEEADMEFLASGVWKNTNVLDLEAEGTEAPAPQETNKECSKRIWEAAVSSLELTKFDGSPYDPNNEGVHPGNNFVKKGEALSGVMFLDGFLGAAQPHFSLEVEAELPEDSSFSSSTGASVDNGKVYNEMRFTLVTGSGAGSASISITYKDVCNPCWKENWGSEPALTACWPGVEEQRNIVHLSSVLSERREFDPQFESGGSSLPISEASGIWSKGGSNGDDQGTAGFYSDGGPNGFAIIHESLRPAGGDTFDIKCNDAAARIMPPELFPDGDFDYWDKAGYKVTVGIEAKQNETLYLPFEIKGHDGTVEDLQISFQKQGQLRFIGPEHDIATASYQVFPFQHESECWGNAPDGFNNSEKFSEDCFIVAVDEDAGVYKAVVTSHLLKQAAGGIYGIAVHGMENVDGKWDFNWDKHMLVPY